ncbi:MAG: hypothetical protein ACTSO9_13870 [Candidatus Helarchaeota archaeon]
MISEIKRFKKFKGEILLWHVIILWIGLICDSSGTTLMSIMSPSFSLNIHGIIQA